MAKEEKNEGNTPSIDNGPLIPSFGYELIREFLLVDLLGKEGPQLLYWAGKQLARRFPLSTIDETIAFFKDAGWGDLRIVKESKDEAKWELSGELIKRRYAINEEANFQLEAGFLAAQMENLKKAVSEAYEEQKKKANIVYFTIKTDNKDIR
ncbi:YslB family protein [Pradoshia sp.]